jgi:lipoprotein NlpI
VTVLLLASTGWTQDNQDSANSFVALRSRLGQSLREGNSQGAIDAADGLVAQHSQIPETLLLAADAYLRSGKPGEAVRYFDQYLNKVPAALPELWQRGIALYFVGDYQRGAEQFEVHRRVNPHDVENAAWHFLCVAKRDSLDKARQLVLPAPNDPRVPMEEVLAMLRSGDRDAVRKRMEATAAGTTARQEADFYGNFYLGLDADARGELSEALELLSKSAADAPHHYMGDVARVYAEYLKQQLAKAPEDRSSR